MSDTIQVDSKFRLAVFSAICPFNAMGTNNSADQSEYSDHFDYKRLDFISKRSKLESGITPKTEDSADE